MHRANPTCKDEVAFSRSPAARGHVTPNSTVGANPCGPKVLAGVRGALVQREGGPEAVGGWAWPLKLVPRHAGAVEPAGQPLEAGVLLQGAQAVPNKVPLLVEVSYLAAMSGHRMSLAQS